MAEPRRDAGDAVSTIRVVAAEQHGRAVAAGVDVEHPAADLTIVNVRGEHDLGNRQTLADALAAAGDACDVLVDLSECTFIDSTVLGVLLAASQEREAAGARLGLVIPPGTHIVYRITDVAGVAAFLPIYASRDEGFAGLRAAS
jgi:anti-sigma B factor antagonist